MAMESSLPYFDDGLPRGNLSKTYILELAYQDTIRKSEMVVKDEVARRLRLEVLLLEDENDELHKQLAIEDDRIDELEQDSAELRGTLEQAEVVSYRYEMELRVRTRELNNLKAELGSMNGLSIDSAKLLTEKLLLTRELATLKTELDHLRSQSNFQQTVLAEKLALQRQVSTLAVELETEKCASKRAGQKERGSENENELQNEVEELRKELSRERRDKEKVQRAGDKGSNEWELRKAAFQSKVEQLRMKLRESKEQVKELQIDLAQAQATIAKASASAANSGGLVGLARKRNANQISTDCTIGTPGGVAVRGKRPVLKGGKLDQASLGEKSTFSITPYLNRTLSIAPNTPQHDAERELNGEYEASMSRHTPRSCQYQPTIEKEATRRITDGLQFGVLQSIQNKNTREKTVLTESNDAEINNKAPQKESRMIRALDKVPEEVDENLEPTSTTVTTVSTRSSMQSQAKGASGAEPKKKKRKILGVAKTIFDEDDGEATKRPAKVSVGPGIFLARSEHMGNKASSKSSLSGSARGFGAFSPLKKERRGAQASFLG